MTLPTDALPYHDRHTKLGLTDEDILLIVRIRAMYSRQPRGSMGRPMMPQIENVIGK